jgi:hypothetical protein
MLDDLFASRDRFVCEQAKPFDARTTNAELKTGEIRVESRNAMLRGHIKRAEQGGATQQSAAPILDRRSSPIELRVRDDEFYSVS